MMVATSTGSTLARLVASFRRAKNTQAPDAQQRSCGALARGHKSVAPGPLDISAFALAVDLSAFAPAARSGHALTKPHTPQPLAAENLGNEKSAQKRG